jgi:glutamate synthase (NADPH/NADH) small chain
MGDPRGFLNIKRKEGGYRPVEERVQDYDEVEVPLQEEERQQQASRCMDCGVPFCSWGCPLGNCMPEFQDYLYKGDWERAYENLQKTNCFPEFTGRICPALCEAACVLSVSDQAVTIRQNEWFTIEKAWEMGIVKPRPPKTRSGKKVAVVGGGPAGMACADILNKAGHNVVLFEAEPKIGGFMRYGIPDFKLDKGIIDRRLDLMKEEGVEFRPGTKIGADVKTADLQKDFDAICITMGSRDARDLPLEGRELKGIHQALDFLSQQNRNCGGESVCTESLIQALDKKVVVIGGGDTGSDCVGTSNRQGAASVMQIELMPKLPEHRTEDQPWPTFPRLFKTSSSHNEGCERLWCIGTKKFEGDAEGNVTKIHAVKVEWNKDENGQFKMSEVPGSEFIIEADLILLAMGFVHPVHEGPITDLALEKDPRGNIKTDNAYKTSVEGVFAAGDSHRGASLVVHAINEGRQAAFSIDEYLKNK